MVTRTRRKKVYQHNKEELENIRKNARKNRQKFKYEVEMSFENSANPDDKQKLDYKLRDYFTNLNALIFWRNRTNDEININVAIKNLEYRLGRKLDEKWSDIVLFLTMFTKNMMVLDIDNPYPKTLSVIKSGYESRREAILESKKQAIIDLKIILGEK